MMTVAFPLSAGSMVMDFSFCSSFKSVLSYLVRFCFGAFADFRIPVMSARSLSFCSCGRLHVTCSAATTNSSVGTFSGVTAPSTEEIWRSNSHASPHHPQALVGTSQGQSRARRTG